MSVQLDTVGTLIVNDGDEDETIGVPLVEAAVLGLSASLTGRRRHAIGSARLGQRRDTGARRLSQPPQGAWEPIVEPWRVRVGVDALIAPEKTPRPDQNWCQGCRRRSARVHSHRSRRCSDRGCRAGASQRRQGIRLDDKRRRRRRSVQGCAPVTDQDQAAAPLVLAHNATTSPVEYWLEGDQTMANGDADRCGTVPGGERTLLCFPDVKSRAAPCTRASAGVETLVSPALGSAPAPTRAVVLRCGGLRRRVEAHRAGQSRGVRPRRVERIERISRRIIRRSSRRRGAAGGGRAGRLEGTERHGAIGAPATVRSRVSERDFDTRGAQVRPATFRRVVLARARRGCRPTSLAAGAVGWRIGARAVASAPRARRSAISRQ